MKRLSIIIAATIFSLSVNSCTNQEASNNSEEPAAATAVSMGQSGVKDDASQKNIVQAAIASQDHSTLVKAVQQAELVDALSNAGPFTVFAPINEAFNKLPAGALDDLMKNENREKLKDLLQYHVSVGVLRENLLQDGQTIGQVNGSNITINKKENVIMINGKAKVLAAIPVSNGMIYAIDEVLMPQ